jgi:hypothetical protein
MESPAKTHSELADDLSRCEKVTLKFDNENHTLTPTEVGWLVAALMSQNSASFDAEKRDITDLRKKLDLARQSLFSIKDNRNNRNWRKPEMVQEAERGLSCSIP